MPTFGEYANSYQERAGQPILVIKEAGYYASDRGVVSHDDIGVSVEREYSLGILGEGSVEEKRTGGKAGLVIPTLDFVTWRSRENDNNPESSKIGYGEPGIEWIATELLKGESDFLVIPPITDPKSPNDRRIIGRQVLVKDKVSELDIKPSKSDGRGERFATIAIEIGQGVINADLDNEELEDQLLGRILEGDILALTEALNPIRKSKAAKVAVAAAEARARANAKAEAEAEAILAGHWSD